MNYKQNEKINQVKESTLVVGIDIGSTTQYARAFDWRGIELGKVFTFSNSREGFEAFKAWMQRLQDKYRKSDVIVGIEPTGHYWFDLGAYLEDEGILLVMVNPYAVKQTKELDDNSQSKNDRKDPKVIAKLVTEGRYSAPYTPDGVYADLRIMVTNRKRLIREMTQIKNRFARWFAIYFPEYTDVFLLIWYSVSTTLFQIILSKIFISDCVVFFDTIATFIQSIAGWIILTGKNVAQISNGISNPVITGIIYWLIRILICGGCLVGAEILLAFTGIKIAGLYKKYCWDMITILVTLISMAIAIYFGDWIKTVLPINLLFFLLFVQLVYVGIRWYVKGWRETRGYY